MKRITRYFAATASALIIILNIVSPIPVNAAKYERVDVGGMPFGVKFFSQGIVVVGFTDIETESGKSTPAYDAGIRINDIITHVNGTKVKTATEFIEVIENASSDVTITFMRNGQEKTARFSPALSSDGKLKTGMWIRDTTAGIGTVTYIIPETGEFAGLGHGICDANTGELLQMERGTVVDVQISGIAKGVAGTPGELKGYFTSDKSGVLIENTACGVYGVMSNIPSELCPEKCIEVGKRDEVHSGKAYIWCTTDCNPPQKFEIEIGAINQDSRDNKSFEITVTDKALIEKTGGIVQGMSGSPIIQDGKLVGAVTHVLISDPVRGYGIFIENMLDAVG